MFQRVRVKMQVIQGMDEDEVEQAMQDLLPIDNDLDLEMATGRAFTQGGALIDALNQSNAYDNVSVSPETNEVIVETDINSLMDLGKLCALVLGIIPPSHITLIDDESTSDLLTQEDGELFSDFLTKKDRDLFK